MEQRKQAMLIKAYDIQSSSYRRGLRGETHPAFPALNADSTLEEMEAAVAAATLRLCSEQPELFVDETVNYASALLLATVAREYVKGRQDAARQKGSSLND